ncbi:Hsp20/alpha crystallin family protein [Bacteriovorax sp. DB6_IX]|uniref:Hsp20/alpha crystallin family protein n=1 Tax=Bacteriovorax sp. DB6_IX TaxID=1353530 RepID=UPI000389E954|nr:Hsp20/alpha crystallin family protein [Bacteriovorax sp. DB6_IX]EQC51407.1 hypothetical protein M901_2529 [Bacteriovorax sp. DB6_IX]
MNYKSLCFSLFLSFSSLCVSAQTADLDQQFQDIMNRQRDLINSMLKDEEEFNQRVEKLMEKLRKQGAFGNLNHQLFKYGHTYIKTNWVQTKEHKKLIIALNPNKDKVNIDIKDGVLTIKGEKVIENKFLGQKDSYSVSKQQFQQSIQLPGDIIESSAKFGVEQEKIVVTFKKLAQKRVPLKKIKARDVKI